MTNPLPLFVLILSTTLTAAAAEPDGELARELQPLRPFVGKTWRGEFKNSTQENPVVDVQRWERALNGQAIRILHSVNDGAYGGESIIRWDAEQAKIEYYYFTTGGFMTRGTMTVDGGKLITHEKVYGSAGGVQEVKGTFELVEGKKLRVSSEHMRDGKWGPGREMVYTEAPDAKVVFK